MDLNKLKNKNKKTSMPEKTDFKLNTKKMPKL
jgi:hypothetical protein